MASSKTNDDIFDSGGGCISDTHREKSEDVWDLLRDLRDDLTFASRPSPSSGRDLLACSSSSLSEISVPPRPRCMTEGCLRVAVATWATVVRASTSVAPHLTVTPTSAAAAEMTTVAATRRRSARSGAGRWSSITSSSSGRVPLSLAAAPVPDKIWYTCEVCQEVDFGGWPVDHVHPIDGSCGRDRRREANTDEHDEEPTSSVGGDEGSKGDRDGEGFSEYSTARVLLPPPSPSLVHLLELPDVLLYAVLEYVARPIERARQLCHVLAPLCRRTAASVFGGGGRGLGVFDRPRFIKTSAAGGESDTDEGGKGMEGVWLLLLGEECYCRARRGNAARGGHFPAAAIVSKKRSYEKSGGAEDVTRTPTRASKRLLRRRGSSVPALTSSQVYDYRMNSTTTSLLLSSSSRSTLLRTTAKERVEEAHLDLCGRTDDAHMALLRRIENKSEPLTPKRLRSIVAEYGGGESAGGSGGTRRSLFALPDASQSSFSKGRRRHHSSAFDEDSPPYRQNHKLSFRHRAHPHRRHHHGLAFDRRSPWGSTFLTVVIGSVKEVNDRTCLACIRELVENCGASVDVRAASTCVGCYGGMTPIFLAAAMGRHGTVEYLLKLYASLNVRCYTTLMKDPDRWRLEGMFTPLGIVEALLAPNASSPSSSPSNISGRGGREEDEAMQFSTIGDPSGLHRNGATSDVTGSGNGSGEPMAAPDFDASYRRSLKKCSQLLTLYGAIDFA